MQQIQPETILDVGNGFGKYAFLVHEKFSSPTTLRATLEGCCTSKELLGTEGFRAIWAVFYIAEFRRWQGIQFFKAAFAAPSFWEAAN